MPDGKILITARVNIGAPSRGQDVARFTSEEI
jgi:hypothetical protein